MPKNPLKLKIAYLYPDILQGICDKANVEGFADRAKWRDIDVSIHCINTNDRVVSAKYDFYYIGGSNIEMMNTAYSSLKENEEELKLASMAGVPMLAVNCGYILFGNWWQLHNSTRCDGIKIFDVHSIAGKKLHYGKIYGTCEFLKHKIVAGFENHSILTYLNSGVAPFINIQHGHGNNGSDKTEGARFNNVIGTYMTSPILPQNPHLCDFLIAVALRVKYKCRIPLTPLCDDIEWFSHKNITDAK